jgi:hypothetical protein
VWRVNDKDKALLSSSDQSKFYTGDCYIFQYTYAGDDKEECLIGTWFGEKSIEVIEFGEINFGCKFFKVS